MGERNAFVNHEPARMVVISKFCHHLDFKQPQEMQSLTHKTTAY